VTERFLRSPESETVQLPLELVVQLVVLPPFQLPVTIAPVGAVRGEVDGHGDCGRPGAPVVHRGRVEIADMAQVPVVESQ